MIITYYGKQFLKIQHGDFTMAMNPISKSSKLDLKKAKFGTNVAMSTTNHPDFNGFDSVTYNNKNPLKINGPGEYEIENLYVQGFSSEAEIDGKKYLNTIYRFEIDGMDIWMLGAISSIEISREIREAIDNVDVLFLPIGGNGTLNPVEAAKLAKVFSSKIIIPIDYGKDKEKNSLETFYKEIGADKSKPEAKLTIKKKDIESKNGEVIALEVAV